MTVTRPRSPSVRATTDGCAFAASCRNTAVAARTRAPIGQLRRRITTIRLLLPTRPLRRHDDLLALERWRLFLETHEHSRAALLAFFHRDARPIRLAVAADEGLVEHEAARRDLDDLGMIASQAI